MRCGAVLKIGFPRVYCVVYAVRIYIFSSKFDVDGYSRWMVVESDGAVVDNGIMANTITY